MSKNYGNDSQISEIVKYISDTMKFPIMGAGGGFAPIGKEGYVDGTLAPEGWLICDGSTHNIADYPDLAAYYASHHGASNYYGGDGITTFAVPVRNGMPTSGVETNEEHIVGEWRETIDGVKKKKPVYEKRVDFSNLTGGDINNVPHNIANFDEWVYVAGKYGSTPIEHTNTGAGTYDNCRKTSADFDGINATNINLYVGTSYTSGSSGFVIIRYTKTTDSWQAVQEGHSADGNGVFCVKATVSGHIYSTTEQQVGVWIDNKTLYEKVVSTGGAVPSGATEIYRESFTGYDVIGYTKS